MGLSLSPTIVLTAVCLAIAFPLLANSAPISISFDQCGPAAYVNPGNFSDRFTLNCCPPPFKGKIIDGLPKKSTKELRIRKATQCTDEKYAKKLVKAYDLMRALPSDDPRSLEQQWRMHCAYCGGSFFTYNATNAPLPIDIHWSWLFLPWHRLFVYFHERILQELLGDPTFSLSFWNWDNPYDAENYESHNGACLKAGEDFPRAYADPKLSTYDVNRSEFAKGRGRLSPPDLNFNFAVPAAQQPIANETLEQLIAGNLNVMYMSMVSAGTTAETFLGLPYRAGQVRPQNGGPGQGGGGSFLEASAHTNVHSWIGQDPPIGIDMGSLAYATRDPVFFAHHSNIDRLFQRWKEIAAQVNQTREYYVDADFLSAEFLFFDEKKNVRRVKVSDALDTTQLGYKYQAAYDDVWIYYNKTGTRCSKKSYSSVVYEAENSKPFTRSSDGYYHLSGKSAYTLVVDIPKASYGAEQFLTIDGIKLDRAQSNGFDIFLNLLHPKDYTNPYQCAEYGGRLSNMGQGDSQKRDRDTYAWKRSITLALTYLEAPKDASKIAVTIMPMSGDAGDQKIQFKDITIGN